MCDGLAKVLGAPCQANVYLTPPNSKGFDLHYDTHDVFIVQTSGTKHWKVYGEAVELPLASQGTSERLSSQTGPQLERELNPNQLLYIPRGWMHEGITTSSLSLHVTFGIYFFTWADAILEAVSHCVLNERKYRSALPLDFLESPANTAAIQNRLSELIADIATTAPLSEAMRSLRNQLKEQMQGNTAGLLKQIVLSQTISDATNFRAVLEPANIMTDSCNTLSIEVPGGAISIETAGYEAAKMCLSGERISVGQLSHWLSAADRIDLVRRLISAGVLMVTE